MFVVYFQLWFQNRRTRLRKMPQLSPVKPVVGDTVASLSSGIGGTTSCYTSATHLQPHSDQTSGQLQSFFFVRTIISFAQGYCCGSCTEIPAAEEKMLSAPECEQQFHRVVRRQPTPDENRGEEQGRVQSDDDDIVAPRSSFLQADSWIKLQTQEESGQRKQHVLPRTTG